MSTKRPVSLFQEAQDHGKGVNALRFHLEPQVKYVKCWAKIA